jgi:hypothetical protein
MLDAFAEMLAVLLLISPFGIAAGLVALVVALVRRGDRLRREAKAEAAQRQADVRFWLYTFNNAPTAVERETARMMLFELGAWIEGKS